MLFWNRFSIAGHIDKGALPPLFRSGGHPACRRTGASRPAEKTLAHTNRAEKFRNRTHLPSFFPGGGTPALYGRRDVCRYNAFAALPRGISNCAHVNWNCYSQAAQKLLVQRPVFLETNLPNKKATRFIIEWLMLNLIQISFSDDG
jgi:hypothetical protein